ncbi:unnamed protein product [Calypogeia fissa]
MEQQLTSMRDYDYRSDGEDAGERPCGDDGLSMSSGSEDDESCKPSICPSRYIVKEWCSEWKNIVWTERPTAFTLWVNVMIFVAVFVADVIIFEASTKSVRNRRHSTIIFPIHVANAVGLSFACRWQGSAALPNFAAFFAGEIYYTARNGEDMLDVKLFYLAILSFVEMLEVQIGADFLRRKLCRTPRQNVPTIDSVHDAVQYVIITVGVSCGFETLAAVLECTTDLVEWSNFARLWSTRWLGVVAGYLTVAPAVIHAFGYMPKYSRVFRPRKVFECLLLVVGTIVVLGLIIFSLPFTTVIRPLPYLLYPLLIFSVFRFNRFGWTLVVASVAFFGSWGTLHYKSSALYYTSGSSEPSSPKLILQIELYMSVLGLVAISLAGAVREKKQLAKDLHNLNQRLEVAVSKRTQELIKANKELQISQAHAEKANLAKSDFLANMSHEIRTPIHGILGLTALLLQTEVSADQLENLLSIKDCADLLLHIINSILDLAKIEAGRLEVETVPFSIRKVVSGTLRMLQVRAKERGLQLLWKVDVDVPTLIAGDPGKLQQCLLNLVGNALKFTHKGSVKVHISLHAGFESSFSHVLSVRKGAISKSPKKSPSIFPSRLRSWASWPSSDLKTETVEDSVTANVIDMFDAQLTQSYLSSKGSSNKSDILSRAWEQQHAEAQGVEQKDKEYVLIEVRDTGIGISKEIVREMFNPFTQADPSTSRLYGGTGLGLSIVQRFVELLGGKIWVESEVGKGSMFSFVVPFRRVDTREIAKGGLSGSPQSSVAVFHPLMTLIDKPPRLKRSTPQQPTIGKGRRAHSLNTLMKNLKFTSTQSGDVEPLLLDTDRNSSDRNILEDADLKPSPPNTFSEADRSLGCMISEPLGDAAKPGPSHEFENLSGSPDRKHSDSSPTVFKGENELGCRNSGNLKRSRPQTVVDVDRLGVGKEYTSQASQSETSLVEDDSEARYIAESSLSTPKGATKAQDSGYRDLELGILDKNAMPPSSEATRSPNPGDSSSPVVSRGGEPVLDEASDAIRDFPIQGQQLQTLLPRKKKLHVLLAEDNMINQKVATRQLQKFGHTVTIVADGLQALNTIRQHHDTFDLVLMDIQMPMMDGLQATQKIREEEVKQGWSRIPILGLTAHAISGYQDTCLSHGMDAYLGKPFEFNQLLKIIQKVI